MVESVQGNAAMQQSLAALLQRIGHIAGVLTLAIVVFASLYYATLYIISE